MADQTPAPTPPSSPAPAAQAPAPAAPLEGTAGEIAARMRAAAKLPPVKASETPAPGKDAPAPGTPPSSPAPTPAGDKPADQGDGQEQPKPEDKPEEKQGALALQLVRERTARATAEKKVGELEAQLKAGQPQAAALASAQEKWKAGKFADAVREAFGVKTFTDDFLVQLAQAEDQSEPLTEEQLTEKIRKQLQAEQEASQAQFHQLREAAAREAWGETVEKDPGRWPTLNEFGISGERVAQAIDASFDPRTGKTSPPAQIMDQLEKEERANRVEKLPYWPKAAEPAPAPSAEPPPAPAPRSFGSDSRLGPVPTAEPDKPRTAEERWAARRKEQAEWRARTFGARS